MEHRQDAPHLSARSCRCPAAGTDASGHRHTDTRPAGSYLHQRTLRTSRPARTARCGERGVRRAVHPPAMDAGTGKERTGQGLRQCAAAHTRDHHRPAGRCHLPLAIPEQRRLRTTRKDWHPHRGDGRLYGDLGTGTRRMDAFLRNALRCNRAGRQPFQPSGEKLPKPKGQSRQVFDGRTVEETLGPHGQTDRSGVVCARWEKHHRTHDS